MSTIGKTRLYAGRLAERWTGPRACRSARAWARGFGTACARFLPRVCLLCEAPCGAAPLCGPCEAFLPGATRPRCRLCARPWGASDRCASCRETPPAFDGTIAAADYAAPLDRAITALKFSGQIGLASGLGTLLAQALRSKAAPASARLDCIVPVPLSDVRLAHRGFNQAHLIAASMLRRVVLDPDTAPDTGARDTAQRCMRPALRPGLLARRRDTLAQSVLQWEARQANLDHGFFAAADLAGLRVGVVDDVMTTGATLQAAALALKAAGAAHVVNLVVARTA